MEERRAEIRPLETAMIHRSDIGMSLALQDRRLERGSKVLAIVGSAGITVGFAAFTY
jgi:hypothetical protein